MLAYDSSKFMKNENAIQRYKNICAIYGEGTVNYQTCQKWFANFHAADFSLNDASVEINNDEMKILLELRIINLLRRGRKLTYSENCHQEFKIICTRLVMLVDLMCRFQISEITPNFSVAF